MWSSPRVHSGATAILLDRPASNHSSLFLTAEGDPNEDITSANHQVAPTYRYGATSQVLTASTQNPAIPTQPMIQPESLPVFRPAQSSITPTISPTLPFVTSARLVVAEPLRSADIRKQDPDPFADPRPRPDTVVSIESPTINAPLPNPFHDPDLFPPEGRVAAWESQMHSSRASIAGLHGHIADLEVARESLLSDASAEALIEVSCCRLSCARSLTVNS